MLKIQLETVMRNVHDFILPLGTCLTLDEAEASLKDTLSRARDNDRLMVYRGGNHVALCVNGEARRLLMVTEVPATIAVLKALVSTVRSAAQSQAQQDIGARGVYQSRGTYLTVDTVGDSILNRAECHDWNGSLKELRATWARYGKETDHAGNPASAMTICGGFDFAESPRAMQCGDYDPWVAEWDVTVPTTLYKGE